MKKFLTKNNFILMGSILILLIIVHFQLLTKNIISADILLNNHFYNGYSWEISLGRFGLYIVGIIKGFLSFPHIDLFISFILISISTFLIIDLFEIKKIITKILAILLFTLSPIISATLLFHYCAIGYFIAFLSGILSVYLFYKTKNKYLKYLVSAFLITTSLSMYQAYFSFIVTLFVVYNLYLLTKNKINYKESFKYLFIFLTGVILYFILMKLSQIIFHINMANYSNANKIGLNTLLNFPKKIIDSYILFYKFFFTNCITKNTYFYNHIINALLLISLTISLVINMLKSKISKLNIFIGSIIILLLPVFLNSVIFVITEAKLQLLMSTSYLFIFLLMIIFSEDKYIKYIYYILLVILFRNYLIEVQSSYMSLDNTFKKYDTIIKTSISKNINNLDKDFVIIGNINKKSTNELTKIYDSNYGFICDEDIFWKEYNLRKIAFTRFVYEYYGLEVNFADEKTYNNILKNRNKKDILYEKDNTIVIDLYNY